VGNKLKKLMDIYNISLKSGNIEKYVEAIILNTKQPVYDEDYLPTSKEEAEDNKDIKKIVNEIFTQNENVIQSYLSQDSIVKLINNSLKNEEEKYKINCWVVISF
jgi:Asp-tRNA(Asn)/Glu-tRNA(Gln) amidotransferase B subunit